MRSHWAVAAFALLISTNTVAGTAAFYTDSDAEGNYPGSSPQRFSGSLGSEQLTGLDSDEQSISVTSSSFSTQSLLMGDVAIAGAMLGQASVSPIGVAQYSVPISIPRSLAGFGPKLSIDYSSQAQSGLLGVGWNIGGLQQVTRCAKTMAQDSVLKGVSNAAGDRFCLGGQRLIKVAGATYGGNGTEYRTEIDSFSKIISYGTAGTGPQYFKVWTKDGLVMEFGGTIDSRVMVNGATYTGSPETTTVESWALNKVSDRHSNYWSVTYIQEYAMATAYPSRIDYAGNSVANVEPLNSVRFEYEARSYGDDISLQFVAGSRHQLTKRLVAARTFAGDMLSTEYRFEYESLDASGNDYTRSRLKSLMECHYKDEVANCLEPTDLEWTSDATFGVSGTVSSSGDGNFSGISPHQFNSLIGDVDGDGRADVVFANVTNGLIRVRTMLANDGGDSSSFGVPIASQQTGSYPVDSGTFLLSDINLDGKADLILGSLGSGGFKFYPLLSEGDGVFSEATAVYISSQPLSGYSFSMADVNSDGLPDYVAIKVGATSATVRVALRVNVSWLPVYEMEIEGEVSTTVSFQSPSGVVLGERRIADIDGDGFPDFVAAFRQNAGYGVYVSKGVGDGTFSGTGVMNFPLSASVISAQTAEEIRSNAGYNATAYNATLQDVNRDGLVDLVVDMALSTPYCQGSGCSNSNPYLSVCKDLGCSIYYQGVHVALSAGGGAPFQVKGSFDVHPEGLVTAMASSQMICGAQGVGNCWVPTYGDIDGDGALDVVRINLDAEYKPWILLSLGQGNGDFNLYLGGYLNDAPIVDTQGLVGLGTPAVQNDMNADGIADIIMPLAYSNTADGDTVSVHVSRITEGDSEQPQQQNLLSRIWRGSAISEEFKYQTLSGGDVYLKGPGDSLYPTIDLNIPLFVVEQSKTFLNGVLQKSSVYKYGGAKADLKGRGFLGFYSVDVTTERLATLPTGGSQGLTEAVRTEYLQQFPYTGFPFLSQTTANGVVIAKTESDPDDDFTTSQSFPGVHSPRATKAVRSTFDPTTGALLSTQTYEVSQDPLYGNLLTETATTTQEGVAGEYVTETVNTYKPANTASWFVDLLDTKQITSRRVGQADIARQFSYAYENGLISQEIVEPNVPALRLQTDHLRDAYGNITFTTISGSGDPGYPDTAISPRTTEWRYEAASGQPAGVFSTQEINPLGHVTSRTFDVSTGTMTSEIDSNGLVSVFVGDALGRETLRTNPDGTTVSTTRDMCANAVTVGTGTTGCEVGEYIHVTSMRTGFAPEHTFLDGLGREVRKATIAFDNVNYIIVRTEYDEAGRKKRVSDPVYQSVLYGSQKWTSYEYDAIGRLTRITRPDGRVTTHVYTGLMTRTTNAKNQNRDEIRNAAGEVVEIKDSYAQSLKFESDSLGRVTKVTDPLLNEVGFELDKLGRKTKQIDPDLGTWNYRYNVAGELVWQRDAKLQETVFTYDKLGRPLTRIEADLDSVWLWDTAANGKGQLAKLTGDNGFERQYTYDSFGRPSQSITKKSVDSNA